MSSLTALALPSPPPCRLEAPCSNIRIASSGTPAATVRANKRILKILMRISTKGSTKGSGASGKLASFGERCHQGRNRPSPRPPFRAAYHRRQWWRRTGGGHAASGRQAPLRGPIGLSSSPWLRLHLWRAGLPGHGGAADRK
ncbi:hypothetical protein SEVIR_9G240755v4 [Setaria viridis]